MISSGDDDVLLTRIARERSEDAFAELYRRHGQPARALAQRMTGNFAQADDAFQEALLRVWRNAGSFRPGNARAWLLQIVARECIRLRHQSRSIGVSQSDLSAGADARAPSPTDELDHRHLLSKLHRFIEELPGVERSLLRLRFSEGLTQRQIGAVMHMPQQTVSLHLKSALARLRGRFVLMSASN